MPSDHTPSAGRAASPPAPLPKRRLPRKLLNRAAVDVGTRCREGVPLDAIPPEAWWIEDEQVHIPYPGSSFRYPSPPNRADLEAALHSYQNHPALSECTSLEHFRALWLLSKSLQLPVMDAKQWRNIFVHREQHVTRTSLRQTYSSLVHTHGEENASGLRGTWGGATTSSLQELLAEIKRSRQHPEALLKAGRRSTLWQGDVWGEPVVIKQYTPNPRVWRRPFEICRARRAWAGANTLMQADLSVPPPLGWLEITSGADAGNSYFISKPLPPSESVRVWVRREWNTMSLQERVQFRHDLRRHLQNMYTKGLIHLDCKLSNIRILTHQEPGRPEFIWTDLEDIRPCHLPQRTFLRNLYQINGSLPRTVSRHHRVQFLKGFHRTFSFAGSPWVVRYVERITRRRHRRELCRQCGA